eukprot:4717598-Alexandrium_andersonii.AAC.1
MEPASWPAPRRRRPPRSSAQRRSQYARSEARVIQRLIGELASLDHRGCHRTRLGQALLEALRVVEPPPAPANTVAPPHFVIASEADSESFIGSDSD